ncbi:MAG: helix-turn-helix transcriptional regulator [Clostridia bacterium]
MYRIERSVELVYSTDIMNDLNLRLKKAREYLGLTQEDVAKLLNISRISITNIESGIRKVSAEELLKLSKIYGWTMEELIEGKKEEININMFARTFDELSLDDKTEILNLIKFKKMYKENKLIE